MKITNSTKLVVPVYSGFFKKTMLFSAIFMTAFSAFFVYTLIIKASQEAFNEFWLTIAVMLSLTFICIFSAYVLLRNKIIVTNGRIAWGVFNKNSVYIDDILAITELRTVTTLYGSQFSIISFSDRKDNIYTLTVNSRQGKEFLDSMTETFGKTE